MLVMANGASDAAVRIPESSREPSQSAAPLFPVSLPLQSTLHSFSGMKVSWLQRLPVPEHRMKRLRDIWNGNIFAGIHILSPGLSLRLNGEGGIRTHAP